MFLFVQEESEVRIYIRARPVIFVYCGPFFDRLHASSRPLQPSIMSCQVASKSPGVPEIGDLLACPVGEVQKQTDLVPRVAAGDHHCVADVSPIHADDQNRFERHEPDELQAKLRPGYVGGTT